MKRLFIENKGQAFVLFAVSSLLIFGITGAAIDIGYFFRERLIVQRAVDAGVMTSIWESVENLNANWKNVAENTGKFNLESAGIPDKNIKKMEATKEDDNGLPVITLNAEVQINTIFSSLVGVKTFTVGARATARGLISAVALVLDNSDSMGTVNPSTGNTEFKDMQLAAEDFVKLFGKGDYLSIVTLDQDVHLIRPMIQIGDDTDDIVKLIDGLQMHQGTNLSEAIALGYKTFTDLYNSPDAPSLQVVKAMVIFTDGAPNVFRGRFNSPRRSVPTSSGYTISPWAPLGTYFDSSSHGASYDYRIVSQYKKVLDPMWNINATADKYGYQTGAHSNGLQEKYFMDTVGNYYFILPDGRVYRYNFNYSNINDLSKETLIDTLNPSYYADPSTLFNGAKVYITTQISKLYNPTQDPFTPLGPLGNLTSQVPCYPDGATDPQGNVYPPVAYQPYFCLDDNNLIYNDSQGNGHWLANTYDPSNTDPTQSNAQTMLREAYNLSIIEANYVKDFNVPIYVIGLGTAATEYSMCPDGQTQVVSGTQNTACPTVTCSGGQTVLKGTENTACPKVLCPDNTTQVFMLSDCPVTCPDGQTVVTAGTVNTCPALCPSKDSNGQSVWVTPGTENTTCPVLCGDGKTWVTVATESKCPWVKCKDGTGAYVCNHQCADGTYVGNQTDAACKQYTCPDGTSVPIGPVGSENTNCPTTCTNGTTDVRGLKDSNGNLISWVPTTGPITVGTQSYACKKQCPDGTYSSGTCTYFCPDNASGNQWIVNGTSADCKTFTCPSGGPTVSGFDNHNCPATCSDPAGTVVTVGTLSTACPVLCANTDSNGQQVWVKPGSQNTDCPKTTNIG